MCCDVCKVGDRERQVAERFYLKQYSSEWVESRGSEEERRRFEQVHPRYATLADSETDAHKIIHFNSLTPSLRIAHCSPQHATRDNAAQPAVCLSSQDLPPLYPELSILHV